MAFLFLPGKLRVQALHAKFQKRPWFLSKTQNSTDGGGCLLSYSMKGVSKLNELHTYTLKRISIPDAQNLVIFFFFNWESCSDLNNNNEKTTKFKNNPNKTNNQFPKHNQPTTQETLTKPPYHYSKILRYFTVFLCETGLPSDVHNMQVANVVLLASVWQGLCPHPHWMCAVCDWKLFYVEVLSISPAGAGLFSEDSRGTIE